MQARALKPPRVVHRDLRGAQVWEVAASSLTLRVHLEHHIIGDRVVARALFPGGIVGDACVVRVADPDYTIVDVQPARHVDSPGPDQAGAVARGAFHPGAVPLDPGESPFWW